HSAHDTTLPYSWVPMLFCHRSVAGRNAAGQSTDLDSLEFRCGWEQPLLCLNTISDELGRGLELGGFVGWHFGDDHNLQRTELHQCDVPDGSIRASAALDWPLKLAREGDVFRKRGTGSGANCHPNG